jgi:hypothetical protein
MSTSLLHQAVELAQSGQREPARQLILQFLRDEPNNEVAWLWLASVAVDQAEYLRALNEVLRINPGNQRAKSLLDEFQQQYGGAQPSTRPVTPSMPSAPYAPESPFARPAGPPSGPPSAPPVSDQWGEPSYGQPGYGQPGYAQMQPVQGVDQQPVHIERERVIERRRGCGCGPGCLATGCGCGGCGQGCLLALLILIVVPMIACGALSYSTVNLGPLDVVLGILPGEFGRENVEIHSLDYSDASGQDFTITASVPRSWYLVDPDDPVWEALAEIYDSAVPFEEASRRWADEGLDAKRHPIMLEMNPSNLIEGGNLTRLEIAGEPESGDYTCAAIESAHDQTYQYDDDLCGYREDTVYGYEGGRVFKGYDPPAQTRAITFFTPVTDTRALHWEIVMPEDVVYDRLAEDIDALIASVQIDQP